MKRSISRREFLREAVAGTGLAVAVVMTPLGSRILSAGELASGDFAPNVWLKIAPDDTVTVIVAKSEMGQGVSTSLPMIVADELEAEWKSIRFVFAPAADEYRDPVWGTQATGGSTSVRHLYEPLRQAGAAAREMLVAAAARQWNVPAGDCLASRGVVRHAKTLKSATYGQLAATAATLAPPAAPKLKAPGDFRYIGKDIPRIDLKEKVNGTALFGIDAQLPGLLCAAVVHPPAFGAKAATFDERGAMKVKGVRQVVAIASGIAVCADTIAAARKGVAALAPRWEGGAEPAMDNEVLRQRFRSGLDLMGVVARNSGDVGSALAGAAKRLSATYELPFLSHVTMEPMNCTARIAAGRCEVWVPTQNQSGVLQLAMKISGLPADKVAVHTTYLGGGFGRRFELDVVEEALTLARATGKPVKVFWSREEDMGHDFYRPMNASTIEGALDGQGKLTAWKQTIVCPSIFARAFPDSVKGGIDPAAVEGLQNMEYDVPNHHVEYVRLDTPVPVGFWRSVGSSHNAFSVELFMDELAAAAGADPVEFRLQYLEKSPHAYLLIKTAAMKAGWGKPLPAGRGRGFAFHRSFDTNVAQVAEVSVDTTSGRIRVHRVVCAVDCGPVVNPEIVRAQMESGICFGLSAALKERVEISKGGVVSANFHNYDILRLNEAPKIEVHLVKGQEKQGGIGEPGVPPIAPAVANALFAATGVRIRELPLTPAAVLKALKTKG